jgi:hypothetical protein
MALIVLGWALKVDASYTANATVVLVIIYNAAFGMSFGPIPWYASAVSSLRRPATDVVIHRLYPPEILPLAFRAKGVSISTATVSVFHFRA